MNNLPISVIVITKNSEKTLEECLSAVQRSNPAEIIVVDGNSSDRTLEIASGYTERTYSDAGGGKSFARQLGAEQARQEYIAYVDSDVVLSEGALATMLAEFLDSDYVSISARPLFDVKSSSYWGWGQRQYAKIANPPSREDRIGMAACLFRRETILKYGFELGYGGYLDDIDLEYRLKRDGHKFGRSSTQIYHHVRADLKSFVWYRFLLGRLAPYYIRKYGIREVGLFPPLVMVYWLGFCLLKGKPKLIPFFLVDGIVQTAGMVKGFFELMREALTRRQGKAG
ncbi:glycosyltransferase family 2 protein [Chloroflexota bacterium]